MAHAVFLVLSEPVSEADDAAYNDWYDDIHLPEVLALSGFTSARRFRMSEVQLASQGGFESVSSRFPNRYVATYEVEGPDLAAAAWGPLTGAGWVLFYRSVVKAPPQTQPVSRPVTSALRKNPRVDQWPKT